MATYWIEYDKGDGTPHFFMRDVASGRIDSISKPSYDTRTGKTVRVSPSGSSYFHMNSPVQETAFFSGLGDSKDNLMRLLDLIKSKAQSGSVPSFMFPAALVPAAIFLPTNQSSQSRCISMASRDDAAPGLWPVSGTDADTYTACIGGNDCKYVLEIRKVPDDYDGVFLSMTLEALKGLVPKRQDYWIVKCKDPDDEKKEVKWLYNLWSKKDTYESFAKKLVFTNKAANVLMANKLKDFFSELLLRNVYIDPNAAFGTGSFIYDSAEQKVLLSDTFEWKPLQGTKASSGITLLPGSKTSTFEKSWRTMAKMRTVLTGFSDLDLA